MDWKIVSCFASTHLNAVFKVFLSAIVLVGEYNNDTETPFFM